MSLAPPQRLGWLTEEQRIDAVAVGQVTPGPAFTTATFIGYLLAGPAGAAVATVGIFLPAFVFVALSGPVVPRLRHSAFAAAFLDGVVAASLEPGGTDRARGFSACPEHGPFPCGTPDRYAQGKAIQFPKEGGPAIVEVEVPEDIVDLAIDAGGEIRFEPGYGLDELLQAWPALAKRIV